MKKILLPIALLITGLSFGQISTPQGTVTTTTNDTGSTAGNVGIGTTNPTAKLHIFNGNHSYGAILANSSEAPFSLYTKTLDRIVNTEMFRLGLKYNTDENNGFISFYRGNGTFGGYLGFSTNGQERLKIDTQGNVGIGTSTPEFKLDVKNGSTTLSQYLRLRDFDDPTNNTGAALTQIISRDGNTMFWNGGIVMGQYANNALPDLGEGHLLVREKVGIGTSNFTQDDGKLLINGKILCEEVEVIQDVLPDYVFQKYYTGSSSLKADYEMPTLEEVEAFTKTNHHLPNVPSAAQVKEEGMQLKEMTTILLQKVEELTLYTIEQEKRIKALEAKLAEKK
ncbi:hypothetical protein [uncultured Kordia sp.]|uniref:hypothetical protein n=1 Tax=uncultured Kordia sp. TaxID=507699 RepID=UPI0026175DC8|nr:hypothetical protein [uncultured Kordia sp.]